MDIVLEMTQEVLNFKTKEKEQLEKRLKHLESVPANDFIKDTDPKYKQSQVFAETEKELAMIQLRAQLVNINGAIQGAKDQIAEIIKEEINKDEK